MSDDNSTIAGGCERYSNADDTDIDVKTYPKHTIKNIILIKQIYHIVRVTKIPVSRLNFPSRFRLSTGSFANTPPKHDISVQYQ